MNSTQLAKSVVALLVATAVVNFSMGIIVGRTVWSPATEVADTVTESNGASELIDNAPPCIKTLVTTHQYGTLCIMGGHSGTWGCDSNGINIRCDTTAGSIPRSTEHCIESGYEACDNIDNNCNGRVDEGFDLSSDNNNCGDCGYVCETAAPFCENGTCVEIRTPQTVSYDPTMP